MPDTETDPRRAMALFRYRVIAEALSLPAGSPERRAALRAQARRSHAIPGSRRTRVAVETMRDWITRYEQDGFEALYPKPRSDRGRSRRMPPEIADLLVSLKERSPRIAVREVIRQARESGRVPAGATLAPSTVNRLLHSEGLMNPDKEQAPAKDRRRFAYRSAGELWMIWERSHIIQYGNPTIMGTCPADLLRIKGLGAWKVPITLSRCDVSQHLEKLVTHAVEGPLAEVRRLTGQQDVELARRIDPEIHFGRLQAGMAEPESDLPDIASCLEGTDGASVPQGVRRYGLARNGRNRPGRSCGVQGESLGEATPRHAGTEGIQEEMPVRASRPDTEPLAQRGAGFLPQRQDAPATALAHHSDAVESRRLEVFQGEANQLRDPQAGIVGQAQHRAVPQAGDRVGSGSVEQGPDLGMVQILDRRQLAFLLRQGMNLCRQIETFRVAELQVAEEGLDRGQTCVAGSHAVVTIRLEVIEEGEQRRCVEMPDLQLARSDLVTPRGEDRQQLEAGGVALNGMRAGAAIAWQVLPEEDRQWPCEITHRPSSLHAVACSLSVAADTWFSRTGVASRYQ